MALRACQSQCGSRANYCYPDRVPPRRLSARVSAAAQLHQRRVLFPGVASSRATGLPGPSGSQQRSGRAATLLRAQADGAAGAVPDGSVSVVLLAGGVGKRMGASIPKQYLLLDGQPIATYSLETFANMAQVQCCWFRIGF